MNFKFDLFMDVLWLGILCGIISSICLQKIKKTLILKTQSSVAITSIIVNFLIGFFISKMFTNLSIKMCLITGLITWIGAEMIYEKLKAKNTFQSLSQIVDEKYSKVFEEESEEQETDEKKPKEKSK